MCNYWANRLCCEAADRAMQVHGGLGYSRHKPFEHIYRHHRRYRITEGSEQIQMRNVAGHMFGFMGKNQRYVMREYPDGWGVPWDPAEMVVSQDNLNGDHWDAWLASRAPALLIHGTESRTLSAELARQMADRRPGTTLKHLPGGHAIYVDAPEDYAALVSDFIA